MPPIVEFQIVSKIDSIPVVHDSVAYAQCAIFWNAHALTFWPIFHRSLINSNKLSAKLYETAVGVASSMSPLSLDFHEAKHIGIWRKLWCRYSRTHKDQAFVRICWWSCRCNVGWGHHMRCSSSDMCTVVSTERQPPSPVCQVHGCIIGCVIDDLLQILLRLPQRSWLL